MSVSLLLLLAVAVVRAAVREEVGLVSELDVIELEKHGVLKDDIQKLKEDFTVTVSRDSDRAIVDFVNSLGAAGVDELSRVPEGGLRGFAHRRLGEEDSGAKARAPRSGRYCILAECSRTPGPRSQSRSL
jgi:hypothetical protein